MTLDTTVTRRSPTPTSIASATTTQPLQHNTHHTVPAPHRSTLSSYGNPLHSYQHSVSPLHTSRRNHLHLIVSKRAAPNTALVVASCSPTPSSCTRTDSRATSMTVKGGNSAHGDGGHVFLGKGVASSTTGGSVMVGNGSGDSGIDGSGLVGVCILLQIFVAPQPPCCFTY